MKRVFHIIARLDVGGAESVAINIARYHNRDVEQHIVELQRGCSAFSSSMMRELKKKISHFIAHGYLLNGTYTIMPTVLFRHYFLCVCYGCG